MSSFYTCQGEWIWKRGVDLQCTCRQAHGQLRGSHAYLLTFDFLGCKHLIDAHVEGLTPELAVSPLGARGGGISGPGPGGEDVRTALAAEANGTLNNKKNKRSRGAAGLGGSLEQLPAPDRT